MTVLQMLTKVIRPEKLLGLVALAELVLLTQVLRPDVPIGRIIGELLAAIATYVRRRRVNERRVKGRRNPAERGARPRVLP